MVLTQAQKEQIKIMRKNQTYLQIKRFFKTTYGVELTGWDIRRICNEIVDIRHKEGAQKRILKIGICENCLHFKTRIFIRKRDIDKFLKINDFITSAISLYKNLQKYHKIQIFFCEFFKTKHKFYIISQFIKKIRVMDCSTYDNMDES